MGRRKSTSRKTTWGIDLESACTGSTKAACLLAGIHRGRTAFDHASFNLRFVKGIASIEEGKLENPSLWLGFGAPWISANVGSICTQSQIRADAAAPARKSRISFRYWRLVGRSGVYAGRARPYRRSGAAAPLFPQKRDAGSLSSQRGRWTVSSICCGLVRIRLTGNHVIVTGPNYIASNLKYSCRGSGGGK